jgi:DNA-binding winged helix-turn-helix (wHTH) protein
MGHSPQPSRWFLREKLGDPADAPRWLLTVRGRGYMLAAQAEAG